MLVPFAHVQRVSIHAPREGCDRFAWRLSTLSNVFQSTHPVRGATVPFAERVSVAGVSIHAPREGCDQQ